VEIQQARYFLAGAETLNFTRAAERCGVTQPALTRGLKALEAELGGPLFHRERGNTHLTELGTLVRPHLEILARSADEAASLARGFARVDHARLRLGVMCTIAPHCMAALLREVCERYPGVCLDIRDGGGAALQKQLLAGALDAIVYADPRGGPDERLHDVDLFEEEMLVVVAPGHPLAAAATVSWETLRTHRYLARANCEFADPRSLEREVAAGRVHSSDRDDVILAMAAAGLGYAFMPERSIPPGSLLRKPLDPRVTRRIRLTTVRGRPFSPAFGAFMRQLARKTTRETMQLAS
jgi:DNA-binding transcriptional LysR family regulator